MTDAMISLRNVLDNSGIIRHCMNCDNSLHKKGHNESGELLCNLDPNAGEPPVDILVYGCPSWLLKLSKKKLWSTKDAYEDFDDDIPF